MISVIWFAVTKVRWVLAFDEALQIQDRFFRRVAMVPMNSNALGLNMVDSSISEATMKITVERYRCSRGWFSRCCEMWAASRLPPICPNKSLRIHVNAAAAGVAWMAVSPTDRSIACMETTEPAAPAIFERNW